MESAPAVPAAGNASPWLRRGAAVLLLAAVALWLFAGQGGLPHPVQYVARGLVAVAFLLTVLPALKTIPLQVKLLIVLLLWAFYTNLSADCPYLAAQELRTWLTAAAAALTANFAARGHVSRRWWLLLAALLVITAVPEFARNLHSFGAEGWRINLTGLPGNSNVLGVLLAVCVPVVAAAIADVRDRRLGLLVMPLLLAGLLLTYSRNAWLTAVIGFAAWWYLTFRGQRAKLLVLLTAIVLVLLIIPATRARLHAFIDPQHPSNIERVDLFRAVGKWLSEDNRLWYGGALGQWGFTYPRLATLDKWQLHTHNVISEWLVGGGIPLALLGLLLISSGFWGRLDEAERYTEALRRAQLLVLVVANLFDYLLWIPLCAFFFFLVLLRHPAEQAPDRRWQCWLLVPTVLIVAVIGMQVLAYNQYRKGLAAAGRGDWQGAQQAFTAAMVMPHPVYAYYRTLAEWRMHHRQPDMPLMLLSRNAGDPYWYWQMAQLGGGGAAVFDRERQQLDPRRMIAGGEEFPQRARVQTPLPTEEADWHARSEGELLDRARNWEESFPAEAQEAYRLAISKDVRFVPAYRYYAEFLQRTGQWQAAIAELTPALTVGGKRPEDAAVILETLAAAHAATGDAERAALLRQQAQRSRDNMITRHAQVIRLLFHIPTLPREGFNDH